MPDPEKSIEDLLKASAEERRRVFGDDRAMPNPMRAALHGEISKMNRSEVASRRAGFFTGWWRQIALGGALALMIAMTSFLWIGQGPVGTQRTRFAMSANGRAEKSKLADRTTVQVGSAASIPNQLAKSRLSSETTVVPGTLAATGRKAEQMQTQPAQSLDGAKVSSGIAAIGGSLKSPGSLGSLDAGRSTPLAPSAAPLAQNRPDESAGAAAAAPSGNAVSTMSAPETVPPVAMAVPLFSQTEKPALSSRTAMTATISSGSAASDESTRVKKNLETLGQFRSTKKNEAGVLDSFRIEASGEEIRVIDADGSVYTGRVVAAGGSAAGFKKQGSRTRALKDAAPPAAGIAGAGPIRFQVTGQNIRLKKAVIFEGTCILPMTEGVEKPKVGDGSMRVEGTAKIEGGGKVGVDAVVIGGGQ